MRRVVLAAAPVLATGVMAAVIVGGAGDGEEGDARAQRGATGVATVQRRTLVDSAIVAGTLGYADERSIVNRLSGTVTWLLAVGSVVRPGETLLRVDGSPVVLMDGRVPAYRALRAGVSDGADVLQLERGLRALGHAAAGMTVDRHWDSATTAAVRHWEDARGLEETGRVELGRIVFAPGARRVSEHEVDVGSTGSGGAAGVADAGTRGGTPVLAAIGGLAVAALDATIGGAPAHAQTPADARPPAATTPPATAPPATTAPATAAPPATTPPATKPPAATTTTTTTPATGAPATDGTRSDRLPGASAAAAGDATGTDAGADGGAGGTATTVLTTTSTRRVVTVALDVADQQLAAVGRRVDIELPDGTTIPGRIARVGTVATTASGDQEDPGAEQATTIDVTIRLTGAARRRPPRLDKAPVSVSLTRESRRGALTVPVTALVARRGGGYAVERIATGGARTLVPVEPGLYADGDVEIVRGLREGDRVAVPR